MQHTSEHHNSLPPSAHHAFPPDIINGVVVMDIVYEQSLSITVTEVERHETTITERRHQIKVTRPQGKEQGKGKGTKEAEYAQVGNFDGRCLSLAAIRKRYGQDLACMCEQINQMLKGSPLANACLPITEENFFEKIMHGVTLCAMANAIEPGAINVAAVKVDGKQLPGDPEGHLESDCGNVNLALAALSKLGISCGDHDANFLQSCNLVIIGVVVQVLRRATIGRVNLQEHEMLRYTFSNWTESDAEETMESMDSKALLCQWVNYQLSNAGVDDSIQLKTLPNDLADSRVYAHLLSAVAPENKRSTLRSVKDILGLSDLVLRATVVVENAGKLGITGIITPEHIAQANRFKANQLTAEGLRNHTINCVFLYRIFDSYPNMNASKSTSRESPAVVPPVSSGGSKNPHPPRNAKESASITQAMRLKRSAKAEGASEETLRMWLNSFGPSDPVVSLDTDLRSGSVLLQVWEAMIPGTVNWSKVKLQDVPAPKRKFTWMSNCAEVMECAKKHGLGKVNCSATDIAVGQKTNTLALVFMMMRLHIKLRRLAKAYDDGGELDDAGLVKWFNESMRGYGATFQLKDINDAGLRNTNALGFLGERVLVETGRLSSGPADFGVKSNGTGAGTAKSASGGGGGGGSPAKATSSKSGGASISSVTESPSGADDKTGKAPPPAPPAPPPPPPPAPPLSLSKTSNKKADGASSSSLAESSTSSKNKTAGSSKTTGSTALLPAKSSSIKQTTLTVSGGKVETSSKTASYTSTSSYSYTHHTSMKTTTTSSSRTVVKKTFNSRNATEDDNDSEPESSNATSGSWLFPSVQPVPNDKLAKYSTDAITMFEKSGIVVYASKLGPGTDVMVYRGILTMLNTFYMQSH